MTWILCLLRISNGLACVQVMFIRQGKVLGKLQLFSENPLIPIYLNSQPLLLGSFICKVIRAEVFLIVLLWDHKLDEKAELEALLTGTSWPKSGDTRIR